LGLLDDEVPMNPKATAAGAVVAILAVASLITYDELKDEPDKTEVDAKAAGAKLEHNVYAVKSDKGEPTLYVAPLADGGVVKLAQSPCARRPTGVKVSDCLMLLPDGGTRDQGDENTMQPGTFTGAGCVRTACVVFAGEEPETGP
jgi:hypothetical protein